MSLTKNFTQGGQVTLHNLRMIRQVLSVTLTTTLLISLAFFCFLTWQDHTPYQKQLALTYMVAQFKTNIPFGKTQQKTQTFIYEDGRKQKVRSIDIVMDPWMKDQIGQIENNLLSNAVLSVFVFLISFGSFIGFWIWRGKTRMRKLILSGSQEVPLEEVIRLMKKKDQVSEFKLETLPLIKNSETKHILLVGTIGSGKTNTFNHLLPQIKSRKQKAVIVDTTGVFVEKFYDSRKDIILNPLDARTVHWDLWKECQNDIHIDELASSLFPQDLKDPFWIEAARTLFVETVKKVKNFDKPSLKALMDYTSVKPISEIQEFYKGTPAASLVDKAGDKTTASIRVTLGTYLKSLFLLKDKTPDFSVREWIQDENQKGWLFLTAMPDQRETLRPLLTTWLNIAINGVMGLRPHQDRRIWFIIDEKPSLNKVEALPKALAEIRKYGGCIVSGLQNISQIDKLYGQDVRKTMASLYNTKVFFRSPDSDTAQWIAKTIGEHEVKESSEGISFGAHQMRDGVSLNEQQKNKAIVPYTEFMSLPDLTAYIKLPESYPVTKVRFSYKEIEDKNMAFVALPQNDNKEDKVAIDNSKEEKDSDNLLEDSTQAATEVI